jgi:signal transduction histidine kinase
VIGVILAVLFAMLFSDRLTRPLNRLSRSAETIGRGNYDVPITVKGRDEIAFLAKTMEEMRQGVVQRDTRLKAMLAGVAHEIRNPLGGIELFAGLLMDDLRGKAQKEQAKKILKEVQTLKAIVNDFLDYARPASPKRQGSRLDEVLGEVHMLLSEELLQSKSHLTWSTNKLAVTIDPQHAQQIFLNLVKNSLQAMPHGGDINVKARSSDGQVEIMVSDSGTGIQEQAREQLFEPFFTTRKTGTGLGLAIVKSLCQANGGDIRLAKSDSGGTTFKLVFEKAKEDDGFESSADN